MFQEPDEKLINKALLGKESAWVKLVKRYESRIYNYALRMTGATDEAMDLVQEIFISVYRNLPNYRGDGVFAAWLFRIASNRCTDFLRKRSRNPLHGSNPDVQQLSSTHQADEDLHRSRQNREILKVLQSLPHEQRQVIELKLFQNMTFDEIEGYTGLSASTAKTRFYTALKKLKQNLEISYAV
jgi:RNA polymerase sigma-70 factor, ECF subfamily